MVRATSLFLATSLAASVFAQNNGFEMPAGFNPGVVSDGDKTAWCQGQLSSCPKICPDGVASKNTCNPTSLTFSCICGDGSTPNVAEYKNTLPFFVCEENFGQCINAHPNDLAGQKECKSQRAQYCGTKKVPSDDDDDEDEDRATTSTAASVGSATATITSGSSSAPTTTASGTTLSSKTRTTAFATSKTAAKSPDATSSAATATKTDEDSGAAVLTVASRGLVAAVMIAVAGLF
ncbi:hypothetical protein KEM54_002304 [Ascosphaera aggregata]|nr:hypothetical protein KEM54_002304 [Ascosphaera aggregata]